MVTKKLEPSESSSSYESSSEDDEQSSSPAASVVAAATKETKVSSDEEEEGQSSEEDEASSEEDEPKIQKKRTPSEADKEISVSSKKDKRAREGTSSEDMKAAKKAKTNEKKFVFQRLWSVEDELIMLQGIIDFKTKTGKTTNEDKNGFYEFIKESVTADATFSQCIAKIGKLRRKYLNKAVKGKKPASSNAHDLKAFELSEKIWGSVVSGRDGAEESRKGKRIKDLEEDKDVVILEQEGDWFSNSKLVGWIADLGMDEDSVKRFWGRVSTEKKKEMHGRWRVLQNKDAETVSQKTEFVYEVVSLIADGA